MNTTVKYEFKPRLNAMFLGVTIFWSILILGLACLSYWQLYYKTIEVARSSAYNAYDKDLVFRHWATGHGGVYVPITPTTPPNPYLADIPERDISTPSGKKLTLLNPAYMTRQIHELGKKDYGVQGHITSLRPIRPENAPDEWERKALQAFEQGQKEVVSLEPLGKETYLRLMRPLSTEIGCLKCHAKDGYIIGDIRGGLSVSMPWAASRKALLSQFGVIILGYGLIWAIGIIGLYFGRKRFQNHLDERRQAEIYRDIGSEILKILNGQGDLRDSIGRVLDVLKTRMGFDAVGLRLQDGEDFPYFSQQGFDDDFLLTENSLIEHAADGVACRDKEGSVRLECTCGLVISGKSDPASPLFTPGGSFWTSNSFPILDIPLGDDPRHHPRNQCMHHGYASIALVPIRDKERIVGLIQLNDRRKGCFTKETIDIMEGISSHIGSALMRKQAEEGLKTNSQYFQTILAHLNDGILVVDDNNRVAFANQTFCNLFDLDDLPADITGLPASVVINKIEKVSPALSGVLARIQEIVAKGKPVQSEEVAISGERTYIRDFVPIIIDGKQFGRLWQYNDITLQKKAENELIEAHKDLEKKVQERTLELEKTNTALQRVSAYSRSLLESNLDAIVTINDEGKITDVNRATVVVTGLPRDELIGSDFADYFTDPDMAKAGYQQFFSQGEVRDYELTLRHRNGNLTPVLCNASLYRDESGKILGVFAAARDITERKTSEWALKESEQRYRTLFTRSSIGISILSGDGKLVEINEYFARVHGYSVPEMLSMNLNDYLLNTPASLQQSDERIRRILAGEVLYFETEHYHKDGHVFPLEVSASLISVGGESCMHCLHMDITERKQAEEVLRKSEARFKHLLQDIQAVAVQGYAPDGTTQYWNHASEQFYGYTAEEAIGRNLLDLLIPPEMRGDVEQAIRQMAETGQPIPAAELSLMRKNGSRMAVYSSHTIVQIPGQTQELFCIDIDMTDRKQAEQDRVAREVAEKANQAKSLFVANMSHEIRTPMNAIMGFAQVLLRDPTLTPQQAEHVRTIHRSGGHLLRLINDILDMSKIEAGRTTLNEAVFCMHDLLDDMTMMFRTRADSQGLQLLMECDENVPRNVTTDEGKLRQVLVNLLGNAVKFTTTGGIAVRVRCKAVEGKTGGEKESLRLEVEVEDTGPGIPDEDIGQIFDPFQQGGAGVKSGGTGLGLAISRKFVEMMGGELTVKSQVGTGSCFRFDLLLKPAAEVVKREKRASRRIIGLEPGTGPVRILAVDDTPNNRAMLCVLLRPLGFEVAEAGNGVEALEIFAKWSPHAVLMDMRMPVMDGYEATRQLKATSKTPVIAITASAFEDTKEQAMATGVDAYIRKPFRMEEICEVLGKYLGLRYAFAGETTPAPDHLEAKPLTGESLAALPQDMIAAMQQAVAEGNMAHLTELIASVEKLDSSTAHALQALADQYEYEKLNQLLEKGGMNND